MKLHDIFTKKYTGSEVFRSTETALVAKVELSLTPLYCTWDFGVGSRAGDAWSI